MDFISGQYPAVLPAGSWLVVRLGSLLLLAAATTLLPAAGASAVVTKRCTNEFKLDGSGNKTPWADPDYTEPTVQAQICLSVMSIPAEAVYAAASATVRSVGIGAAEAYSARSS